MLSFQTIRLYSQLGLPGINFPPMYYGPPQNVPLTFDFICAWMAVAHSVPRGEKWMGIFVAFLELDGNLWCKSSWSNRLVLNPRPCCSFARHLVGKGSSVAHLLVTKHSPVQQMLKYHGYWQLFHPRSEHAGCEHTQCFWHSHVATKLPLKNKSPALIFFLIERGILDLLKIIGKGRTYSPKWWFHGDESHGRIRKRSH